MRNAIREGQSCRHATNAARDAPLINLGDEWQNVQAALAGAERVFSLLADLDVHPRVAVQILRHAQFSITMVVYAQVSTKATREAPKRLGESLDGCVLLYSAAVRVRKRHFPSPSMGNGL